MQKKRGGAPSLLAVLFYLRGLKQNAICCNYQARQVITKEK